MRKISLTLFAMLLTLVLMAQSNDPILGKWENPSGEGRIEIYKKGDAYFGKLFWIKDSQKKDAKNPDDKLKKRAIQGLEILTNFKKEGNAYQGGQIYDPKSGKHTAVK